MPHPVIAAADRHVLAVSNVMLDSIGAARDALDLDALEGALAGGNRPAAEAVALAAIAAMTARLEAVSGRKAPTADESLEAAIAATLAAGGRAVELCVPED
jgi:hypothetical protein